ncbi:MAG: 23S rRNA (pseudouridine(1915)-N(3))-methyltransferase RlmH [Betaproteobacteria bacterium]|nr:23S rRNA (pseudouridine(1915)-N(3))-methyltransferase RlmH [Betaproteobacteria bacterium]
MKLTLIALGHKMPAWAETGFQAYAKRMPPEARIALVELKPEDRAARTVEQVLAKEAERIEAALPKGALRIVLDERGTMISTRQLAGLLRDWMQAGAAPAFIIGSADGLAASIKAGAHHTVALSGATLPHALVRVLLAEQLYRAWSVNAGHPYHRE